MSSSVRVAVGEQQVILVGQSGGDVVRVYTGQKGDPGPPGEVANAIDPDVTDVAPSQKAVHDALLTKLTSDGTNKITVGSIPPDSPQEGDLWVDTGS